MSEPVSTIPNLGPASDAAYALAGIHCAQDLRDLGPDAAYAKLLKSGSRPHFIAYYAMVMGLQGRPWNDCQGKEKDALRARFDAIKENVTPDQKSGMARVLDELGIGDFNAAKP